VRTFHERIECSVCLLDSCRDTFGKLFVGRRKDGLRDRIVFRLRKQIRRQLPQAYSIFIAPPSLATLEQRLRQRAADAPQVIAVRLAEARNEIEQARLFDYLVVNDDLTAAEAALLHIIKSQRYRLENQTPFLNELLGSSNNA